LAVLNISQVNQPPIISATANRTEVHRAIESFVLEASIVDERTPSENLTVKMFINNSVGSVIEVQIEYVNATGSWIGIYTLGCLCVSGSLLSLCSGFGQRRRRSNI